MRIFLRKFLGYKWDQEHKDFLRPVFKALGNTQLALLLMNLAALAGGVKAECKGDKQDLSECLRVVS